MCDQSDPRLVEGSKKLKETAPKVDSERDIRSPDPVSDEEAIPSLGKVSLRRQRFGSKAVTLTETDEKCISRSIDVDEVSRGKFRMSMWPLAGRLRFES